LSRRRGTLNFDWNPSYDNETGTTMASNGVEETMSKTTWVTIYDGLGANRVIELYKTKEDAINHWANKFRTEARISEQLAKAINPQLDDDRMSPEKGTNLQFI